MQRLPLRFALFSERQCRKKRFVDVNRAFGSTLLQHQAQNALGDQLLLSESLNYGHSLSLPMEISGWEAHEATPARAAWRLPFSEGISACACPSAVPILGLQRGTGAGECQRSRGCARLRLGAAWEHLEARRSGFGFLRTIKPTWWCCSQKCIYSCRVLSAPQQ